MRVLASLEVAAVVKELQHLVNSKVSKIYQPARTEIIISFHKTNEGRFMLRILPGQCLYLTSYKKESPKEQLGFCKFLRKRLNNTILIGIEQKNFERVVELKFKAKEENFIFIAEFFSKGNIILCKDDYTILSALEVQIWKDRQIKAMEKYSYPPSREVNILAANFKEFENSLVNSDKENIVKALAIDFGLGGVYSEELCKRAGIEKNKKELTKEELKGLFSEIKSIGRLELRPISSPDDVFPFHMETKEAMLEFKTFNEALDSFYSKSIRKEEEKSHLDLYKAKIEEQERILKRQVEQLESMQRGIEENKEKGDLIYKNYAYLKEIWDVIKNARDRKISWEEIEAKLKTKGIKVNGKEGKVAVELK